MRRHQPHLPRYRHSQRLPVRRALNWWLRLFRAPRPQALRPPPCPDGAP